MPKIAIRALIMTLTFREGHINNNITFEPRNMLYNHLNMINQHSKPQGEIVP